MSMLSKFAIAGALALAIGGAMSGAALARGGGGGGGGGGDVATYIATPPVQVQIPPGRGRSPQVGVNSTITCHYDIYSNIRECERLRRY
jgi:hypothetical protein